MNRSMSIAILVVAVIGVLMTSGGHAAPPIVEPVDVNVVNQPVKIENVHEPVMERYQQELHFIWNSFDGTSIQPTFPVFGDPNEDVGIPFGGVLELKHVGLRITDFNDPPIEGVFCLLRVQSGNTGRNLNYGDIPIVVTPVPSSQGIYVASQSISQFHFFPGANPILNCVAKQAPGFSIIIDATISGHLVFDSE